MALLNNEPRSATVLVTSPEGLTAFVLTRGAFERVCRPGEGGLEEAVKKRAEELVTKVPIFKDLSPEMKKEMVSKMKLQRYDTHEYIFHQGDHAHEFFIIIKGQVKVTVRKATSAKRWEEEVARLGAGECFGELALMAHGGG
eukprot:CAMPEP_0194687112 /NCGR_PEP_ID=MMETSP0295-20121207/15990_1 /TAXON_ID=39354 /ORGANISM="Heterosigma akashiwo, Strain CCMP2393" /LENGTH=141 /DNA_ID=CAMNT_0039575237 /DNA_START=50 /DNA_END=472 /DNA_ORIENTATION=-